MKPSSRAAGRLATFPVLGLWVFDACSRLIVGDFILPNNIILLAGLPIVAAAAVARWTPVRIVGFLALVGLCVVVPIGIAQIYLIAGGLERHSLETHQAMFLVHIIAIGGYVALSLADRRSWPISEGSTRA